MLAKWSIRGNVRSECFDIHHNTASLLLLDRGKQAHYAREESCVAFLMGPAHTQTKVFHVRETEVYLITDRLAT